MTSAKKGCFGVEKRMSFEMPVGVVRQATAGKVSKGVSGL